MTRRCLPLLALVVALTFAPGATAGAAQSHKQQKITFYFGLKRPEDHARRAFAAVGRPGSSRYRSFVTVRQAARRYGASHRTVSALRRAARRHHLTVRVDRSGVFARVRGTVRRFERTFHVRIRRQFDNDVLANTYFVAGEKRLRLPRDMRRLVREVVAVYARSAKPPRGNGSAAAPGTAADAPPAPGNAGTWLDGCAAARATGSYSFAQVRHAYGIDALGAGRGGSVAILNAGEGVAPADIAGAAKCFGLPRLRTRTLLTDGQSHRFGRGSFEPQEDLALVRGMAPGLRSVTFAQVWLAPSLWFLGAADVLDARRVPDSFSISYGECERAIRGKRAPRAERAGASLMDSLLVRLGLAGVSTFASAGDFGSTCNGQPYAGVAWPASSPFLTAVGGTRLVLDAANDRTDEVVWNDLRWMSAQDGGGAGGGGFSAFSRRPGYQHKLALRGRRRAVPDVSAHASMFPGWPVSIASNWIEDAGTSASAPLLAGAFAALSARERRAGRAPLGPLDGLLYALRRRAPQAFFDVVSGNNGYKPKVRARRAHPGYDLASGLGVPRFDRLGARLPRPAR